MNSLFNVAKDLYTWAQSDFRAWPLRFILEITAWAMSIGCAVTMAVTVPNPPFLIMYPIFIAQCVIFGWSASTRGSFGMLANYCLLVSIDTVALIRLLLQ
jgi:hypothetical protein